MKKQIFLLSLFSLLFASSVQFVTASSCCTTTCNTTTTTSNCNSCTLDHGHTFRRVEPTFQLATPVQSALFSSESLRCLNQEDKKGRFQLVAFGGKSTNCANSAAYYFPYGHTAYTVDGSVTPVTFSRILAESDVLATAAGEIATVNQGTTQDKIDVSVDPATYKFDPNKDTSKLLPWNFGITYAALFEPFGVSANGAVAGTGLVTNPAFKSTLNPTYRYTHAGAGATLRYHFSDDAAKGFFGIINTAVEYAKSDLKLNESVVTVKGTTALNTTNYPLASVSPDGDIPNLQTPTLTGTNNANYNIGVASGTAPVGNIYGAYLASSTIGFPTDQGGSFAAAPANMEEAFAQSAWSYGKISGCQKITRLADIELALGYAWTCNDCASTNWYLGLVIPTGNKVCADYLAPAIVGNGQHFGLMTGSTMEVQLSDSDDWQAWYRIDLNGRYLFRNTQKRSFDLLGKEWSRYMMVWANKAAYTTAVTAVNTVASGVGAASRAYSPGINIFTADMYIKPGCQGRVNQALYLRGEHFRAELGWNVFARQKECASFSCTWDAAPAFADSSYEAGIALNNGRTIYNDSQTTAVNVVANLLRTNGAPGAGTAMVTQEAIALGATDYYSQFAISADDVDLNSAGTPAVFTNTPYASLGYAWSGDYMPQLSVGGSYEFSATNSALNQWLVWGKFEIAF